MTEAASARPARSKLGLRAPREELSARESDGLYREIFEHAPVSIWIEDWSDVKATIDRLRPRVKGWRRYFERRHDKVIEAANAITVTDVSNATLEIHRAKSVADIVDATRGERMDKDELKAFREQLIAFAEGATTFRIEGNERAMDGSKIVTRTQAVISARHRDTWSRVIYAIDDITERKRAEEALRLAQLSIDHAGDAALWLDGNGRLVYANDATCDMLGYSHAELLALSIADIDPDVRHGDFERASERIKKCGSSRFEARYRTKAGAIIPVEVTIHHLKYGDKELMACNSRDISERTRMEAALRESEERLQSMASNIPGGIFRRVLKLDGSVTYPFVSDRHRELFGFSPDELMADASHIRDHIHPEDYESWSESLRRSAETLHDQDVEVRFVVGADEVKWVRILAKPRRLENGDVVWDGIALDVTERKVAQQRIDYLAHHDALTDLPNRVLFRDRLETAMAQAERDGHLLAVHLMDLDRFKEVNDNLGHPVGDELLKAVATTLKRLVRATDTVARLGGDEFAVVETGLNDPRGAVVLARKITEALAQPFALGGHVVRTGATIGIAVFPNDGTVAEELLKHADVALYTGKRKGRNTYELFDSQMSAALRARKDLESELQRALEENEFEIHYQPRIEIATGRITGAEALVRWRHPARGLVLPGEFIPVAEDSGLILPLGEWLLREVCTQFSQWKRDGASPPAVAVNLSAVQLRRGGFVDAVRDVLASAGVDPSELEFEIAETMLIQERDSKLVPALELLRDLGVTITVDDFGTGSASFTYLRHLPVSKVKIDRSFIAGIAQSRDDKAIVQAIIRLGRGLDMEVTAEGVETEEQATILKAWDCDQAQGYLFSPPVPADDLAAIIRGTPLIERLVPSDRGSSQAQSGRERSASAP